MKRNKLNAIPVLLAAALLALFAARLMLDGKERPGSFSAGQKLPEFSLPALSGATLSADSLRGKPAIINFFASWCVSCRAEHELLEDLARESGVAIYGIAWKDKPEKIRAWLEQHGNPYRDVAVDDSGRTVIAFGVSSVPETFLVSTDGVIAGRWSGPLDATTIKHELLPLIPFE